jgi:hypothetical protein
MTSRHLAVALLIAFAPVAALPPAWAQGTSDEASTNMARARFKEGVGFFDRGQFDMARAAFLQAYALKKHPAILLNLGLTCLRGGHAREAYRYFKQYLADAKDITEKQRADANDGVNQALASLGQIEVTAAAGSDVTVDAEHVGTAPLSEPIAVEIGAHTIKVRAPDGTTDAQSVTVLRGEREVARFVRAVPAPAPAPAPASAPTEPPPSPPVASPPAPQAPPAPPREEPPSVSSEPEATTSASARHGSEFWPANKVPIYIGAGLVVAGAGVAIGMLAVKQSAQDKANSTAASVQSRHGMVCGATGVCKCPAPAGASASLVGVCAQYANDQDQINQDATAANIAIGVGIAALVGTVVYWIVARKQHAVETTLVPVVGPKYGGLSLSAPF